jgi:DNA repair exonuclease SbcCD ATPase subunit
LALSEAERAKRRLSEDRNSLEALNRETVALGAQGLSAPELDKILSQLHRLGYPFTELSQPAVDRLLQKLNRDRESSSKSLEQIRSDADRLQHTLEVTLGLSESSVRELSSDLSRIKKRLATAESLKARLLEFSHSFPWSEKKPLAELVVEAKAIRRIAVEMQAAAGRERRLHDAYAENVSRKKLLEQRLAKLQPRVKRLTAAQSVLQRIRDEYSLSYAMQSALKQHRTGIEAIFSRIHTPAEFSGIGSSLSTLVRETDGSDASLSEISCGQRAAFALSVFLAQNTQLSSAAPPVVLIDDPIAHVDDLNSLSFLDYLREIALTDGRQIFFATASDKLASLFERKFDFLGEEAFCRIDLTR